MDKYYVEVEINLILPLLDELNLFVVDDYFCSTTFVLFFVYIFISFFSLIRREFAQAPPNIIKHVCKLTT